MYTPQELIHDTPVSRAALYRRPEPAVAPLIAPRRRTLPRAVVHVVLAGLVGILSGGLLL